MDPIVQLAAYMFGAVLMRAFIAYVDARLAVEPVDGHELATAIATLLWPASVVIFACVFVVEGAKRAGSNARKRARR